jgi:chromosome segregation ATPase
MSNLKEKLEEAVKDFSETEAQLIQAQDLIENLEKRREQLRGRVVTLQELAEEEGIEVVDAETVEDDK